MERIVTDGLDSKGNVPCVITYVCNGRYFNDIYPADSGEGYEQLGLRMPSHNF